MPQATSAASSTTKECPAQLAAAPVPAASCFSQPREEALVYPSTVVEWTERDDAAAEAPTTRREKYRTVFLRSDRWKEIRNTRLVHDDYCCQVCGFRSDHNEAHHIYYLSDWNKTETRHLRTLCHACHVDIEALSCSYRVRTLAEGERRWRLARQHLDEFRAWRCRIWNGGSTRTDNTQPRVD